MHCESANSDIKPTPQKPTTEPKPMRFCRCSHPMGGRNEFGRKDCNPRLRAKPGCECSAERKPPARPDRKWRPRALRRCPRARSGWHQKGHRCCRFTPSSNHQICKWATKVAHCNWPRPWQKLRLAAIPRWPCQPKWE